MRIAIIIAVFQSAHAVTLAPCDQNVVGQAFREGFLTHVLMNCITDDPGTGHTISGSTPVDPALCFGLFASKYKDVGPYPLISGTSCGSELQNFVLNIMNVRPSLGGFSYNLDTRSVDFTFNYADWSSTYAPKFLSFAGTSGTTMGSSLCTGYQVRDLAKKNIMASLVKQAAGGPVFGWPTTPENDYCILCYAQFVFYLTTTMVVSEKTVCNVADPSSNTCYASQAVTSALIWFNTCAGFPITFTGPLCSTSYVTKIESYLPYYTITSCMINSDPGMCQMMAQLIGNIENNSDTTCTQCYVEFVIGLKNLISSSTRVTNACAGSWNSVWSTQCIQVLTDLLASFSICAGLAMDTSTKVPNFTSIQLSAQTMIK